MHKTRLFFLLFGFIPLLLSGCGTPRNILGSAATLQQTAAYKDTAIFAFHHYSDYESGGDSVAEIYANGVLKFDTSDWDDRYNLYNCMNPSVKNGTVALTCQQTGSDLWRIVVTDIQGRVPVVWPSADDPNNYEDARLYSAQDFDAGNVKGEWLLCKKRPDFALCFLQKEGVGLKLRLELTDSLHAELSMPILTKNYLVCQRAKGEKKEIVRYPLTDIQNALRDTVQKLELTGQIVSSQNSAYYPAAIPDSDDILFVAHENAGTKADQIYYINSATGVASLLPFPSKTNDYSDPVILPTSTENRLDLLVSVNDGSGYRLQSFQFKRAAENLDWILF